MLTRPALLLHVEEALLLVGVLVFYAHFHFSWLLFALLFLVPDLFMGGIWPIREPVLRFAILRTRSRFR
jgi:hypothetical protein